MAGKFCKQNRGRSAVINIILCIRMICSIRAIPSCIAITAAFPTWLASHILIYILTFRSRRSLGRRVVPRFELAFERRWERCTDKTEPWGSAGVYVHPQVPGLSSGMWCITSSASLKLYPQWQVQQSQYLARLPRTSSLCALCVNGTKTWGVKPINIAHQTVLQSDRSAL